MSPLIRKKAEHILEMSLSVIFEISHVLWDTLYVNYILQ